jgi:transposase
MIPKDSLAFLEKLDARKQTKNELHERRVLVIHLYHAGVPVMQITQRLGLSWSAVNAAIKLYNSGGADALVPHSRGRKEGSGRLLSQMQEKTICRYVCMRRPWFYGLKASLWSLDTVMQLIEIKLDIKISARGLGNYLKRWGLIKSNADKRSYDTCAKDIRMWLNDNYEKMAISADNNNAEIIWMHSLKKLNGSVWESNEFVDEDSPPELKKRSLISIENNQGKREWIVNNGSFSPEKQIKFLKNIITEKEKNIYIIRCDGKIFANNHCWHWMKTEKKVQLFPELPVSCSY